MAPTVIVIALAGLAFALRVHRLEVQSLWLDEALSVVFARTPLPGLLPRLVVEDIHPPLFTVALHFWMLAAGQSEFAVRFLSVVCGVLLVPLAYRLAVDLFADREGEAFEPRLAGLIAATMATLSPFLVYYSQEARNYIVVTLFTALSCWSLWRALALGGRRRWVVYAVACAATVYTHYYGGFVLAAQAAYLAVTWRQHRQHLGAWVLSGMGAVVLYLPWLIGLQAQLANILRAPDYWFGSIDFLTVVGRTFAAFTVGRAGALGPVLAGFALLLAIGALVLLARGGLRSRRGELFLLFYAVVPLLAVYAITARNPKFAERYLIMISPAFYLVLARGLAALYGLGVRLGEHLPSLRAAGLVASVAGAAVVAGASAMATWQVYYDPGWAKDDYRGVIRTVMAQEKPGDFIILTRNAYHPMEYYYAGTTPWKGLDPAMANRAPNPEYVAGFLNQYLKGKSRVWHILWQEEVVDPTRTVAALLRRAGRQVPLVQKFAGVRLELYELPANVTFAPGPQTPLDVAFENGMRLRGRDLLTPQLPAGGTIDLGLYWHATRPLTADVGLGFALKDARGFTWAAETHRPSSEYLPATLWSQNHSVRGSYPIIVPPGTPPGKYAIEMNVHDAASLRELSIVMASGQPVGARTIVGEVEVVPLAAGTARPSIADLKVARELAASWLDPDGGALALLGTGPLPASVAQGGTFDLSLYWERQTAGGEGHEIVVRLGGPASLELARAAIGAGFPTPLWITGERLRDQVRLRIPPGTPAGDYRLEVGVIAGGHATPPVEGGFVDIGSLSVVELPRVNEPPPVDVRQGTSYGDLAELYGYSLAGGKTTYRNGETIQVNLVWRALASTTTGYAVFAHLADASQRPWSQHDGPPAEGNRPTTGWVAGEYVSDPRQISVKADVPPGKYRVLVGMYGPDGKRLEARAANGSALGTGVALSGLEIEVLK